MLQLKFWKMLSCYHGLYFFSQTILRFCLRPWKDNKGKEGPYESSKKNTTSTSTRNRGKFSDEKIFLFLKV